MKRSIYRERLLEVISPIHKHYTLRTYTKVTRKLNSLRSSLRKRSKDNDVDFNITQAELIEKFIECYGQQCKYCTNILTYKIMVMDHIVPITKGGPSTPENLHFICKRCNTIKGPLTESDFMLLMITVGKFTEELHVYTMRKLSKGGRY